jgi:probable phosphoglycerate mutase
MAELVLVRHGETPWSVSRQHTSRTDLPLTPRGEEEATRLGERVRLHGCAEVWTSPMRRAQRTAELAGFGAVATVDDDLREWDYGIYEGRTTAEIQEEIPGWTVWTHPLVEGETVEQVGARADRVIDRARDLMTTGCTVALFAHAHLLRVLGARWIDLAPVEGRRFVLDTSTVSVLGYERDTPAIVRWNERIGS